MQYLVKPMDGGLALDEWAQLVVVTLTTDLTSCGVPGTSVELAQRGATQHGQSKDRATETVCRIFLLDKP